MTRLFSARHGATVLGFSLAIFSLSACFATSAETATADKSALSQSAPAPPADGTKYDMRYKLKTGNVLRYEASHRASVRSMIDDTTQSAQTTTKSVKLWKVTDVLPNGDIEFMNVVERVHMVNQLPDRDPVEYDSQLDATPPPGFEDAAKAVGVPLSVVRMTPRGEVVRRDIKFRHLAADDDGQVVLRLPDEPVTVGATWDEALDVTVEIADGQTKAIQTRRHFKLAKVENDIATIEVTYQILSPVDAREEAQLVQRMMAGTADFNIKTGRVVGQKMAIDKKILGFAGPTSSLQYMMQMDEKAVDQPPKEMAVNPAEPAVKPVVTRSTSDSAVTKAPTKKSPARVSQPRRATRSNRSAGRTRPVQKVYTR